jgi:transcriptional repressor NrdR
VMTALRKREVDPERVERAISGIVRQLESIGETEIRSEDIGRHVMTALKGLDDVAYVRFASVYHNFRSAEDFQAFLSTMDAEDAGGLTSEDEPDENERK